MSARWLQGAALAGTLALAQQAAAEEPRPPKAATSTVAVGLSAEDLELAAYLDLLEDMDLLADFEALKLLPVLEDDQ